MAERRRAGGVLYNGEIRGRRSQAAPRYESCLFKHKNFQPMSVLKKILLLAPGMLLASGAFACFIMFLTDGKNILIANHEDWYARDAEVSFVPATEGKMGM